MQEQTQSKLHDIFREVLHLEDGADVPSASQGTVPDWDSLATALIVAAIASEFGIDMDASDALAMTSYAAAARYLEARGL